MLIRYSTWIETFFPLKHGVGETGTTRELLFSGVQTCYSILARRSRLLPNFQPDYGYVWVMGLMDYQLL
jgi:hypothetical protein